MITVTPIGSQPAVQGQADYFTGTVRIDTPFQAPPPARVGGATVTFEPGARTAWHTHPLGQTLFITAGSGLVQEWGGPVRKVNPGDVVVTSGLGGSYAPGLIIGTVVKVDTRQGESTRRVIVSPNDTTGALEEVLVVFGVGAVGEADGNEGGDAS